MIKRTLFFGNPAYLKVKNRQLIVESVDKNKSSKSVPIEDIGFIILENPQITITTRLLDVLLQHKAAVIVCDERHMPCGFFQTYIGHSEQTERIRKQLELSEPLKKNLWQQTVKSKIQNQMLHLKSRKRRLGKMFKWMEDVKSGDAGYHEAYAAAYYFKHIFEIEDFTRGQKEEPPNNLLNYGYAILRAVTARAIVGTGLLPSVGLHHKNKYNAYCLADDIMEPYRPYVDALVQDIIDKIDKYDILSIEIKQELLKLPVIDVKINNKNSPLMTAMSRTTNSLYECYAGISRKLLYPVFK